MNDETREIGDVGNYYGCLEVTSNDNGKYYWSIEDYDGHSWVEIPEYLYMALNQHEDEREAILEKTNN